MFRTSIHTLPTTTVWRKDTKRQHHPYVIGVSNFQYPYIPILWPRPWPRYTPVSWRFLRRLHKPQGNCTSDPAAPLYNPPWTWKTQQTVTSIWSTPHSGVLDFNAIISFDWLHSGSWEEFGWGGLFAFFILVQGLGLPCSRGLNYSRLMTGLEMRELTGGWSGFWSPELCLQQVTDWRLSPRERRSPEHKVALSSALQDGWLLLTVGWNCPAELEVKNDGSASGRWGAGVINLLSAGCGTLMTLEEIDNGSESC